MKKKLHTILLFLFPLLLSAQIPNTGLIAYYPFNGNANDQSGNNMNGTVNGATLTADRFCNPNNAYSFNGSGDFISLPTASLIGLDNYSYSTWIKPLGYTGPTGGMVWCAGENGPYCQGLTYQLAGNLFGSSYNLGYNPVQSYCQSGIYSLGNWMHVVVTRNNTEIKMYINGILSGYGTTSYNNGQSASYGSVAPFSIYLGGRTNATAYFNGLIDDVRIYNVVLSQNDVTALYNENFVPAISSSSYNICEGSSLSFTATTTIGTPYWYSESGLAVGTGTAYSPGMFTTAGNYTYYVASGSCNTNSLPITVVVNPSPVISISASSPSVCANESVTLTASGASTYAWFNGITTATNQITAQNTNYYTVTGTNNNGCSNTETIILPVKPSPQISITISRSTICQGERIDLIASGADTYLWNNGSSTATNNVVGSTTTYTVTGTDNNGCSANTSVSLVAVICEGIATNSYDDLHMSIYPNPNNGSFMISSVASVPVNSLFVIEDLNGKAVKTYDLEPGTNLFEAKDLSVARGIYFCRLIINNRTVLTDKIIITN